MGDGSWRPSVRPTGVRCAIASKGRSKRPSGPRVTNARAGRLNAGEPIAEGGELFGESVNEAERIASLADGGEILVSQVVRELVAGKGFRFTKRAEEPRTASEEAASPLYEVLWQE